MVVLGNKIQLFSRYFVAADLWRSYAAAARSQCNLLVPNATLWHTGADGRWEFRTLNMERNRDSMGSYFRSRRWL
jgi:hypothetical protein